ncbi:MAG: DUF1330 domain-containing protein [Acetobacterales bacterium]
MTAYLIVHRRQITDSDALRRYRDGIDASIRRYGGSPLVRADNFKVLEGDWHSGRRGDDSEPERVTIIAFPDMEGLRAWYDSADYAELKALRQSGAVCDVVAVAGD